MSLGPGCSNFSMRSIPRTLELLWTPVRNCCCAEFAKLMKIPTFLLFFVLALSALATDPLKIYVAVDQSVRGPFTDSPPALTGETVVTLNSDQVAQFRAFRTANPAALKFTWDGSTFALSKVEQLRLTLLADFGTLSKGQQLMFKPAFEAVKVLLDEGNVAEARVVIDLSGFGLPSPIAEMRATMLAHIDALFPSP